EQPTPPPPLAGGGATAGGRQLPLRDPPQPSPTAVLPPPRLPRLQALARPRLPCRLLPPLPPQPSPPLFLPSRQRALLRTFPQGPGSCLARALLLATQRSWRQLRPPWMPPWPRAHLPLEASTAPCVGPRPRRPAPHWRGAVLRAAGDAHHFHVALVGNSARQITQAVACVYSSETGIWGNLITTLLQSEDRAHFSMISMTQPAVLVGGLFTGCLVGVRMGILEFDMDRQRLSVIPMPVNDLRFLQLSLIRADGGGIGLLILSGFGAQFWKTRTNC
ncbi:LOW QUALITY PROTEIN: hypothetical protein CFC21_086599, partial [Triticum aestivum]